MADPEGIFSIAFDAAPMTVDPTWTRIDTLEGCRVREWSSDRGRPTEFDKIETGTAVVRIVDREGLFDPTNSSSAYYGKVLPGKQAAICLQNPISDAWFTQFRGFIESWNYTLDQTRQFFELELQLVDGFAILERAELQVGVDGTLPPFSEFDEEQRTALNELGAGNVLYGETTGTLSDRITGILGDVNWPTGLQDVFSGNVQIGPKAYGVGTTALDALWDCCDAEFPGGVALMYMSKEGVFRFRGRQARFRPDVAEYGIQRRDVGTPPHTELDNTIVPLSELEFSSGQDNIFNVVTALPQWVGTGATIRQLNPDPPANDNVAGQTDSDTASIAAYGRRSISFDQLGTVIGIHTGNNSMEETRVFVDYYLTNYAEFAPRPTRMVFKSRRPGALNGTALWLHLCKCELTDLLTLKTEHPGDGFFDQAFYVEGIHITCRPAHPDYPHIEMALDVSPQANFTVDPFPDDEDP